MLDYLKKNQVRIKCQTSNNFYKPFINRADMFQTGPI